MADHDLHRRCTTPVRLIIADGQERARSRVRGMVEDAAGLLLVGEATNGREAMALCRELQPDLVVLDAHLPRMDGLTAARMIKQSAPATHILIVTPHENAEYVLAALQAGAVGCVRRDISRSDLLNMIRRVMRGETMLNRAAVGAALHQLAQPRPAPVPASIDRLTRREREVLALIVEGGTNRQIAAKLSLSVGTVKIHVEHIIAKLGVTDRTQAAVRAVQQGLLRSMGNE